MKEKELEKYLKQESWYHGTTLKGWYDIQRYGVLANYNQGNELDFGYGFNLTPKYKQAKIICMMNFRPTDYFPGSQIIHKGPLHDAKEYVRRKGLLSEKYQPVPSPNSQTRVFNN